MHSDRKFPAPIAHIQFDLSIPSTRMLMTSVTISTFTPYLFFILGLITTLNATRGTEALVASPLFQDLIVNLAYVSDAIEATQNNGKEAAKVERARRKAHIRIWRGLRSVSLDGSASWLEGLLCDGSC